MIEFFTVTLKSNVDTLEISIPKLYDFYQFSRFSIICPKKEKDFFLKRFKNIPNVHVISEDSLITKTIFEKIASEIFTKSAINTNRVGWYYQQVLKLAFALSNTEGKANIIMWDADTIPLRKINFFNEGRSFLYGSLIEYHLDYFKTIQEIFAFTPPQIAYTVQFFTLTYIEKIALHKRLVNYVASTSRYADGENISVLVSKAVLHAIKNAHQKLDNSLISEQELVGLSNSIINPITFPIAIVHFRPNFNWSMTAKRLKILSMIGYSHATSENHNNSHHMSNFILFYLLLLKDFLIQNYRFFIRKIL